VAVWVVVAVAVVVWDEVAVVVWVAVAVVVAVESPPQADTRLTRSIRIPSAITKYFFFIVSPFS
jgi:hypothetical protein